MKVSIITVCFNSCKTLERTLQSVLGQSYLSYEYIIVDGASTDGTLELIKRFEPLFAGRLRYISEPDKGIYDAMNKGIRMATGELIGILNSDDWYEENALAEAVAHIQPECPYQVVYGVGAIHDEDGDLVKVHFVSAKGLKKGEMIFHPASFVTADTYRQFGLFDLRYRIVGDLDFMMRLDKTGQVTFIPVLKILAHFTKGGISTRGIAVELEKLRILEKYGVIGKGLRLCKQMKMKAKRSLYKLWAAR
jgi:glycosyltransferase involved in cell wall biosynthesis